MNTKNLIPAVLAEYDRQTASASLVHGVVTDSVKLTVLRFPVGFAVLGEITTDEGKMVVVKSSNQSVMKSSPEFPTVSETLKLAEDHIGKSFSAFILMDGLKKIMAATATGTLASIPKTIAVATWVETVKQMALAGRANFPAAPYTFEEVVSE